MALTHQHLYELNLVNLLLVMGLVELSCGCNNSVIIICYQLQERAPVFFLRRSVVMAGMITHSERADLHKIYIVQRADNHFDGVEKQRQGAETYLATH